LQVTENNKKMEELGLRPLADSVRSSMKNASSEKRNKKTNEKDHCDGLDSSYLPRSDEGQEGEDGSVSNSLEKVSSHTWLGCFTLGCPICFLRHIFMQVLIPYLFPLVY
jgi:hypothetical protein